MAGTPARLRPKFTVTAEQVNDKVPRADVVLKLTDYKFELEGKLRKGPQVIRVETPGPGMHEFDLFRLHDGHADLGMVKEIEITD